MAWAISKGSSFTVLYDSCVLYPAPLRDLLMQLALTDLFRAKWTDAIHEEWMRNVAADRPDLSRAQLERTRDLMNANVRDCLVTGFEPLVDALPDARLVTLRNVDHFATPKDFGCIDAALDFLGAGL